MQTRQGLIGAPVQVFSRSLYSECLPIQALTNGHSAITHAPGLMLITDLENKHLAVL
jgi:hypothetical protein